MGINLNEHEGIGGKYLDEGVHVVQVTDASIKDIKTGSKVLEIHVADNQGRACKVDGLIIYHKDGKEQWSFVVEFLKKSGIFDKMTDSERANFGVHMLRGKRFAVRVSKQENPRDGKVYSRIDSQTGILSAAEYNREMDNTTPPPAPKPAPEPQRAPAPGDHPRYSDDAGADDDLPF